VGCVLVVGAVRCFLARSVRNAGVFVGEAFRFVRERSEVREGARRMRAEVVIAACPAPWAVGRRRRAPHSGA